MYEQISLYDGTQGCIFNVFHLRCSVMAIPNTMIYFTLYDQLKVMYGFEEGQKNVWSPMFAGITARSKILYQDEYFKIIEEKRRAYSEIDNLDNLHACNTPPPHSSAKLCDPQNLTRTSK